MYQHSEGRMLEENQRLLQIIAGPCLKADCTYAEKIIDLG
jgi:hypothetical protein